MFADAQIGYHVALLNNAIVEPRTNETICVEVDITDSEETAVCAQTQNEIISGALNIRCL